MEIPQTFAGKIAVDNFCIFRLLKRMKRVTIKDLSKLLNLSTSTVSRALSDHPDISSETKERVRNAAHEFNYTTNLHARFFRTQQTGLIALILPEVNTFFTPSLIRGINKTTNNSKYSLITFLTNDSLEKEIEMIQQCLLWSVEAVLISLSKETVNLDHLAPLKTANIKCVLLDKVLDNDAFVSVTIDSAYASYKAVSHLIEKGHTNILGIFGNRNFSISQERIKGYKNALKENNLPVLDENIITVEKSDVLDSILPAILNHNKKITAIFTMSDELLAKSIYHINALKLAIPQDISIISISDGIYPYLTHPQVSHVRDSGKTMGRIACEKLIDLIGNQSTSSEENVLVSTRLVVLDSVS